MSYNMKLFVAYTLYNDWLHKTEFNTMAKYLFNVNNKDVGTTFTEVVLGSSLLF